MSTQKVIDLGNVGLPCDAKVVVETNVFGEVVLAVTANDVAICGVAIDLRDKNTLVARNKVTGVVTVQHGPKRAS